jgi:hypothetical protein
MQPHNRARVRQESPVYLPAWSRVAPSLQVEWVRITLDRSGIERDEEMREEKRMSASRSSTTKSGQRTSKWWNASRLVVLVFVVLALWGLSAHGASAAHAAAGAGVATHDHAPKQHGAITAQCIS